MTKPSHYEQTNPLISVIMTAYNCEPYIAKAIDSILSQSYNNIELLINDDASTDNTWEVIQSYSDSRIKAFKSPTNNGYLKTTNAMFNKCNGEYITFQDADDWSSKDRILRQKNFLLENSDTDFCGTACYKFYNESIQTISNFPKHDHEIKKSLTNGRTSLFCGATLMLRKNLLEKVGHYRIIFDRIGAEDIDWYIRALKRHKGANLPEPLYHYRQHQSSITKSKSPEKLKRYSADIAYAFYIQSKQKKIALKKINSKNLKKVLEENIPCKNNQSLEESIIIWLVKSCSSDGYTRPLKTATFISKLAIKTINHPSLQFITNRKRKRAAVKILEVFKEYQLNDN